MSVKIDPAKAPRTSTALAYIALSLVSLLASVGLATSTLPSDFGPAPRLLAALHLLTVGFAGGAVLGIGRQMTLTAFSGTAKASRNLLWPFIHAALTGLLALGFSTGRGLLVALAGGLLVIEVAFLLSGVLRAAAFRTQLGSLHAFLGLSWLGLGAAGAMGGLMALRLGTSRPVPPTLLVDHAATGMALVFLPAVMGASLQLVPMFSAARPHSPKVLWGLFALVVVALSASCILLGTGRGPLALLPLAVPVILWAVFQLRALARGRPKPLETFFLFSRLSEVSLVAAILSPLLGASFPFTLRLFFAGFLVPSVLGFLSRILPFLLWLSLTEHLGFRPDIPKIGAYFPERAGFLLALVYFSGLLLSLIPIPNPVGWLALALSLVGFTCLFGLSASRAVRWAGRLGRSSSPPSRTS